MKIGIITLLGKYNYGNRLQNLAVTELLSRRGFQIETIVCESNNIRTFIREIIPFLLFWKPQSCKKRNFSKFNKKHLKFRILYTKNAIIPNSLDDEFDYFAVGSDQVWNPEIRKTQRSNFFLKFTKPEKRLCMAPSIGIDKIPNEYENDIRNGVDGISVLCCRETIGASEIQRISGKPCLVLLDPTLALDNVYWRSIGCYKDIPHKKYAFCMFLGNISNNLKKVISDYCNNNNLIKIEMTDSQSVFYSRGPEYFISLIDKASVIFTDSFHAIAFSVNLNKQFYVLDRILPGFSSMNSRILSLLSILGIQNRFISEGVSLNLNDIDYVQVNNKLLLEREKWNAYLDDILKKQS